jgi:ATP-dependent DNA ligase
MPHRSDGFIPPCIPTGASKPPAGSGWVHEIKHDGYRLQVRRDGDAVRLFTRRGYDWSDRYPAIVATAAKLRAESFTLDAGEEFRLKRRLAFRGIAGFLTRSADSVKAPILGTMSTAGRLYFDNRPSESAAAP